jgi:cytochrome bd-type quinol oxidase subunit 1
MPVRAQYALVLNAVTVVLTMTLMGYARSASRVHWHIYGVMRDDSPYAYSPALGYAASFMALCTFLFCSIVLFIFWVASMGAKHAEEKPVHAPMAKSVPAK